MDLREELLPSSHTSAAGDEEEFPEHYYIQLIKEAFDDDAYKVTKDEEK